MSAAVQQWVVAGLVLLAALHLARTGLRAWRRGRASAGNGAGCGGCGGCGSRPERPPVRQVELTRFPQQAP